MDALSLYRKYRPDDFDNLVGQDHITTTLINAFKSEHVSHAYLFAGPRGTGKTSSARLIAKALNCKKVKDGYNPCNQCDFCVDIGSGSLIDLIEIDAASNRGIDEIRDLKEKINFAPTRAKYKVYIIDEVHMLTKEAFNALLKTLEEPPEHAYFILATTEVHKIPETIISRCQRFDFRRLNKKALEGRLKYIAEQEKIKVEDKALQLIGKYSDGCMRDAIGLLEQLAMDNKLEATRVQEILGLVGEDLLESLYNHLLENKIQEGLDIVEELHSQGSDLKQFLHEFIDFVRNKMLESVNQNKLDLTAKLVVVIDIFRDAQRQSFTSIPQLALEIAVARVGLKFGGIEPVPNKAATPAKVETKPDVQKDVGREHSGISEKVANKKPTSPPQNTDPVDIKADATTNEAISLNLDNLKDHWPRITERVTAPALRMSLKNSKILKIEDKELTLEFSSKFHRDKVMEHDNRIALEAIIEKVAKSPVKVMATVSELDIKPVMEENEAEEAPPINAEEPPKQKEDDAAKALDIFGGELVN